jgi:hypothetical protein
LITIFSNLQQSSAIFSESPAPELEGKYKIEEREQKRREKKLLKKIRKQVSLLRAVLP